MLVSRDYLQEMRLWEPNKPLEEYFSETEKLADFIPPLVSKGMMDDVIRPKNFTLLMFGKKPINHFEGAYSIFSIYRGVDRSEPTAERHEITGTIVQQARKLIEKLNTENYVAFDKEDEIPNQVKYPSRALQEAVVNALVHRDYESSQPVRVTVFNDRIEFNSPGALPRAVDKEKFLKGKAYPHWRNQTLAWFFNKLQLAQAEGQGIPTIMRTMREEGCPDPVFDLGQENVVCILPAHPRHKTFKELHEIENKIIIDNLDEANERTKSILSNDPYNFRAIELFCEINNLLKTPKKVYNFLIEKKLDVSKINSSTLIKIADTLSFVEGSKEVIEFAIELFHAAKEGQLEEREILKITLHLKKLGRHEEVISFIDEKIDRQPALGKNTSLLEERAKARMSLASKCIDTGKKQGLDGKIRRRAWEECRRYLSAAEKDLNDALDNTKSGFEREYILRDVEFLNGMKTIAQKPSRKGPKYIKRVIRK
ncbi:MAG: hypothetical protein EPO28_04095 [Saprospiraceae bacterium]|nr:MAG: hypothetical protein EPO28_04095 [Saprospiraceae bacterium]